MSGSSPCALRGIPSTVAPMCPKRRMSMPFSACTSPKEQLAGAGGLALPGVPEVPLRLYRFAGVLRGAGPSSDLFSPCCTMCPVLGEGWGEDMGELGPHESGFAVVSCVSPPSCKGEGDASSLCSPLPFLGDSELVVLSSEITVSGSDSGSFGRGRIRVGVAGL
jgi:hypothetical protein